MAPPWTDQVWIPGQPQHCQEMWICLSEMLRFWLCPILSPGCVPFPAHPWPQAVSWVWAARTEPGIPWVCSFLEGKPVKENIRTEHSEKLGHRDITPTFSTFLGFFSQEKLHGDNKKPELGQEWCSRSQFQYSASGHHLQETSQL